MNKYITRTIAAGFAASALVLGACSGTRDLRQPTFSPGAIYAGVDSDSTCIADIKWWEFYTDTILTKIIRTTLDHNRDLLRAVLKWKG